MILPKSRMRKNGKSTLSTEYRIWDNMISRCTRKTKNARYSKYYFGKGVSPDWDTFAGFWADMGDTYFEGASLDRIETEKGYNKENCRWITKKLNNSFANNKWCADLTLKYDKTLTELCTLNGLSSQHMAYFKKTHTLKESRNKVTLLALSAKE